MTAPEEPAPAVVMAHHVVQAFRMLNDGAVVSQVLEDLWRTAFADGVRRGQKSREQSLARHPSGLPPVAETALHGWQLNAGQWLQNGTKFRFGGTDSSRPNCDRAGTVSGRLIRGRQAMTLADTGETVPLPALFWYRLEEE